MTLVRSLLAGVVTSAALLRALPAQTGAMPVQYPIDAAHSEISFTVGFMGLSKVRGSFGNFNGTIMYDAADPTRASVSVQIATKSIYTGQQRRDSHLRSPDFFDAEKYPLITFRSAAVERDGSGLLVRGPLVMHGVTKEVTIRFTQMHGRERDAWGNHRIGFSGQTRINRRDFGVVGGAFWNSEFDPGRFGVSDSVDIDLTIEGRVLNFDQIRIVAEGKLSLQDTLLPVVEKRGIQQGLARYRELKRTAPDKFDFSSNHLNTFGYTLMQHGRPREAIEIFKLALADATDDANLYDSLGEAYVAAGDKPKAIESYREALARDSTMTSAGEMLRWLQRSPLTGVPSRDAETSGHAAPSCGMADEIPPWRRAVSCRHPSGLLRGSSGADNRCAS